MFNELKDWPRTLRINAAAARLAPHLNTARAEAFSRPEVPWDELPDPMRTAFLNLAALTIESMQRIDITIEPRTK